MANFLLTCNATFAIFSYSFFVLYSLVSDLFIGEISSSCSFRSNSCRSLSLNSNLSSPFSKESLRGGAAGLLASNVVCFFKTYSLLGTLFI